MWRHAAPQFSARSHRQWEQFGDVVQSARGHGFFCPPMRRLIAASLSALLLLLLLRLLLLLLLLPLLLPLPLPAD